jgi:DNA-binding CsgD family transcriptional regulator
MPWRSQAALAYARAGAQEAALALAREEVELARSLGCQRALGVALTAMGVAKGVHGLASLEEAVSALSGTDAQLELARARCELGAALRRGNRCRDARVPLREALAAAEGCGAGVLAARARAELLAAGARPRRTALRGVESLTASELRVARFAAEGCSNREIAAALVVSVRTVEFHLSGAYGKLGIAARRELAGALATQVLEPAGS